MNTNFTKPPEPPAAQAGRRTDDLGVSMLVDRMLTVTEGVADMRADMRVMATGLDGVAEMRSDMRTMATAITKLAVIDERQIQASLAQDRAFKVIEKIETRLDKSDERVDKLEQAAPMNAQIQTWVMALVWGAVGLVLMFVVKKAGLL